MDTSARRAPDPGPSLGTPPFDAFGDSLASRLLTDRQRRELASLSTRVTVAPRGTVYRAQTQATAVFICADGAVKAFRDFPSGKRRVVSFLFARDLFGLAANGRYVNTVQALTRTTCYRIALDPLKNILRQDAELEFRFLSKVVHDLRELQLQTIVLGRRSARGRLVMFLKMFEDKLAAGRPGGMLPLPMSRSDIADYLGLSLEAVSRACRQLSDDGIVTFESPRSVRIKDRVRLDRLAADV
jgi:CRP-like cAMP-binding protein